MPKIKQETLDAQQREQLLQKLEKIGKRYWEKHWKESMALPEGLSIEDKESVLRYLLLRVLLNQQGDTDKVKELARELFNTFKETLLYNPSKVEQQFESVLEVFHKVGGRRGSEIYRVGALGGIKPLSLFLYRLFAFNIFICTISSFYSLVKDKINIGVGALWEFLRDDPILDGGWVGNDPKAARMLTNWFVWLFSEVWNELTMDLSETMMIVDGQVGKIFCRTGTLETVYYEKKRPYIILAKDMRKDIESIVKTTPRVAPMLVDEGAFQVAKNWCSDIQPNCHDCQLSSLCLAGQGSKKHLRWTAYKKFET
jgi:endonuclease III